MKNFILGLLLGIFLTAVASLAIAQVRPDWFVMNDVWTDSTNTLKIIGQ